MCDAFTDATTPTANPQRAIQLGKVVTDEEIKACKIPGDVPMWRSCAERVWGKRCGIIAHYEINDKTFGKRIVCYHHCATFLRDNKRNSE